MCLSEIFIRDTDMKEENKLVIDPEDASQNTAVSTDNNVRCKIHIGNDV